MVRRVRAKDGANSVGVYHDHQRRTCILVAVGDGVEYIPLDIQDGFKVHTTSMASFSKRYTKMVDYPIDKAASLYLNYALAVGATSEAVDRLSKFTDIADEVRLAITSKRNAVQLMKDNSSEKQTSKRSVKSSEPIETPRDRRRAKRMAKRRAERRARAKEQGL